MPLSYTQGVALFLVVMYITYTNKLKSPLQKNNTNNYPFPDKKNQKTTLIIYFRHYKSELVYNHQLESYSLPLHCQLTMLILFIANKNQQRNVKLIYTNFLSEKP